MILFLHRGLYISVVHRADCGSTTQNIGRLFNDPIKGAWLWDRNCPLDTYWTLNGSEKRQIIGMLDDLNQVTYRSMSDMHRRWEEIIGPAAVKLLSEGAL